MRLSEHCGPISDCFQHFASLQSNDTFRFYLNFITLDELFNLFLI